MSHGLASFRVRIPWPIVEQHDWVSCRYVSVQNSGKGSVVIGRLIGDEAVMKPIGRPCVSGWVPTPRLVVPSGNSDKYRVRVQRARSSFVFNIPSVLIAELDWKLCRYVMIEPVGNSLLIIRRMIGDEKRGNEGSKYPVVGD